jgi:hypothetical protein
MMVTLFLKKKKKKGNTIVKSKQEFLWGQFLQVEDTS